MLTDRQMVLAAASTYDPDSKPIIQAFPDKWWRDSAVRIFSTPMPGINALAIEGTHDPVGWALDFLTFAMPYHSVDNSNTDLGPVHAGFYQAALKVYPAVRQQIGSAPFALIGHSLGAALAALLGAMLIADGIMPVQIGLFAPPRVGSQKFLDILKGATWKAWRYGSDPVPTVPFRLMPEFPYYQLQLTGIGTPVSGILGSLKQHHITNYVNGIPEGATS